MPMFVVNTNVARSSVPEALLLEATNELSKAMGKPAQYIAVDDDVRWGGRSVRPVLLDQHRIYINFTDMPAANVAWNNSTFG